MTAIILYNGPIMTEGAPEGRVNCLSYVYRQLGIQPEEEFVNPIGTNLGEHFEVADNLKDAVAIAVVPKSTGRDLDVMPEHMALLDPNDKTRISHRLADDSEIVPGSILDLRKQYPDKNLTVVFLKLKEKVPVPA